MAYFHTTVLDNQVKALPTVDTASGAIATFDTDLTENLIEVVCDIQYSQASGTPTPDNPLPITTFSEMNVSACGKNLNAQSSQYIYINLKAGDTIYIKNNYPNALTFILYFRFTDETTDQISMTNGGSYTYTLSKDLVRMAISPSVYTAFETYGSTLFISKENTAIEPFSGSVYNIPFGQTVAKGTLNVTTGVLEITHKAKDLGNLNYSYNSSNQAFITNDVVGISEGAEIILSCYTDSGFVSVTTMPNNTAQLRTNALYIKNSAYTDPSLFKTAMNGQTIVYEANETIQLDSKTITALLNENNIWCDTNGDTEIKFLLTVGKKIA